MNLERVTIVLIVLSFVAIITGAYLGVVICLEIVVVICEILLGA